MRGACQRTILSDFKRNWIFLAILFISCIPQFLMGYSHYLLILLYPIILINSQIRFYTGFWFSLLFGFAYTIPLFFHETPPNYAAISFTLLYPSLFYLIPQYLNLKFKNRYSLLIVTVIVITCMASWTIFLNIEDTVLSKSVVNISRNLSSLDNKGGPYITATNHNMLLSLAIAGIGMIFVKANTEQQRKTKFVLIIIGLLSLYSGLHLLNRTAIALAFIACIVPFVTVKFSAERLFWLILILGILALIFFLFVEDSMLYKTLEQGFESRSRTSRYTIESGGGRDIRMLAALQQILETPLGADKLHFNGSAAYAHNTWLDCGVQAGWMALLLLLYITYRFLKASYLVIFKQTQIPSFWRAYLAILTVILMLQLSVEPGIQGGSIVFFMIFYLWSMFDVLNSTSSKHALSPRLPAYESS